MPSLETSVAMQPRPWIPRGFFLVSFTLHSAGRARLSLMGCRMSLGRSPLRSREAAPRVEWPPPPGPPLEVSSAAGVCAVASFVAAFGPADLAELLVRPWVELEGGVADGHGGGLHPRPLICLKGPRMPPWAVRRWLPLLARAYQGSRFVRQGS